MSPQDEEKVGVWNFSKDDCILVEDAIYGLNAPTGKTGDAQKSRQEFKKLDSQSELDRIAKLLKGKAVGCTMRVDNVAYQYTMRDGVKTLVKKPDRGLKFSIAVSRERLPLLLLETKALGEQKWKKKRESAKKSFRSYLAKRYCFASSTLISDHVFEVLEKIVPQQAIKH